LIDSRYAPGGPPTSTGGALLARRRCAGRGGEAAVHGR
jgi:hypothetical protein